MLMVIGGIGENNIFRQEKTSENQFNLCPLCTIPSA